MNLQELGEYKHKLASLFAKDPDILSVMLGNISEDTDTDELLFGKDNDSPGHIRQSATALKISTRRANLLFPR